MSLNSFSQCKDFARDPDGNESITQFFYRWCVTALSRMNTSNCSPSFGPLELSIVLYQYINAIDFNDNIGIRLRDEEIAKALHKHGLEWSADHHDSVLELFESIPDVRSDGDITEASLRKHHVATMGGCPKGCNSETEPARSLTSILEGADDQDSVWSPS